MLKRGIFSKIFVLITLMSLIGGLFILTVTIKQRTRDLEEALIQENKLLAEIISINIETAHLANVLPFTILKKVAEAEDITFLWIVKPNGEIFYANDPKMFGRIIEDSSLSTKELVIKDDVSPKDGEKIKLIVSPLKIEVKEKPWSLYLGVSLETISGEQRKIIYASFAFFTVVMIIILFTSFYLAKGITNPLNTFRKGAEIIGKGNLDYRIEMETGDEIEELGKAFNQMAENLKKYQIELEESKMVLQIKVKAKTKELRELTENLDFKVKEKTKELQNRIEELERFHQLTVGRELKMIELKREIKRLKTMIKKLESQRDKI